MLVVVTGASSGIGEACAYEFAKNGHTLVLGARRADRLGAIATRCRELGAKSVLAADLDVRQETSVQAFGAEVAKLGLAVDVLVNNAGLALGLEPIAQGRIEDWQTMMDTNVIGLMRVSRLFLSGMLDAGKGHIINIGSIAGFQTYANGAAYAASKHAVRAISGALRLELCGTPLRVSEIAPGMVETEFSLVRFNDRERADAVYQGVTPLSGHDIADLVYFVATRPAHVNVDHLVVMPTQQASVYKVHRR